MKLDGEAIKELSKRNLLSVMIINHDPNRSNFESFNDLTKLDLDLSKLYDCRISTAGDCLIVEKNKEYKYEKL